LGTIQIPDSVATKQLESKVQNERNNKEAYLQEAQLERERTAVQVNTIGLEQSKVVRTAEAEAALLRAKAKVEANRLISEAQINGTMLLFRAANIVNQEQMTAFTYIRTLKNHRNLTLDVSYLSSDNILRTKAI
jgi:regulator of protease activity HflC (stomatin/prohibitin superfamily)